MFYNENIPTQKEEEYKSLLLEFLREKRNDIEIKNFGLDNGFLAKHTNVILKEIKNELECKYHGANSGFHLDKKEIKVYIWLKK